MPNPNAVEKIGRLAYERPLILYMLFRFRPEDMRLATDSRIAGAL